jgi:hypothetical protein
MTQLLLSAQNRYQSLGDFRGVQSNQSQGDFLAKKSDEDEAFPHFGEMDVLILAFMEEKGEVIF